MRVIARLNMGGPAHHVGFLSGLLDPARYETILFHGEVGAGEAALSSTADRYSVRREIVPGLRPELRPLDDLRALVALVRAVRRFRPEIVHTHTAKAGMLGRLAALSIRPRPIVIHTYHGHVLEGYFGPLLNAFYRTLERGLGLVSNVLIGVSSATVDDLVRLRIAPRSKFRVVPIGLDLEPFLTLSPDDGNEFRNEAGANSHVLLTFVGRLVPIKRVDVLLRAVARAADPRLRLAIVGDGELRAELEALADELGIRDQVWFAGYRAEMLPVAAASDIAVLSSDNEGTPVSLIEAGAAATVAASTRVGGVADVVTPATGVVVPAGDGDALGDAIAALAADASRREQMGARARAHVRERYSVERLVRDIDELYAELLSARARRGTRGSGPSGSRPSSG
jgi:glycosyltransferase involved in cell wall biosynthesis